MAESPTEQPPTEQPPELPHDPYAAPPGHKSGFVAIVGKPNVGKSTLLNALLGVKLSAVSHKASTTRHRILGIRNADAYQMVFVDTPGVIKPKYALHRAMMGAVGTALGDADVVLLMAAPEEHFPEEELKTMLQNTAAPVVLVVNKADVSDAGQLHARIAEIGGWVPLADVLVISALKKFNLESLERLILGFLPEGPPYFPKDQVSDRPEKFFVAEAIREQIFRRYEKEIPYGAEVTVRRFETRPDGLVEIEAEIHVERESQKGILIGHKGEALKRVGTGARKEIEAFLAAKVFLQMVVRVTDNWKARPERLRALGYEEVVE